MDYRQEKLVYMKHRSRLSPIFETVPSTRRLEFRYINTDCSSIQLIETL